MLLLTVSICLLSVTETKLKKTGRQKTNKESILQGTESIIPTKRDHFCYKSFDFIKDSVRMRLLIVYPMIIFAPDHVCNMLSVLYLEGTLSTCCLTKS